MTRPGSRVLAALLLLCAGCGGRGNERAAAELLARLDDRARIAQLILLEVEPRSDRPGSIPDPTRAPALGGYWISGGDVSGVARLIGDAHRSGALPPLLGADLNEGLGGTGLGGSTLPALSRALMIADRREVRRIAEVLAREGHEIGLDLGLVHGPPLAGGLDFQGAAIPELIDRTTLLLEVARSEGLPLALGLFGGNAPEPPLDRWDRARLGSLEIPLLRALRTSAAGLLVGPTILPALSGDRLPLGASPGFMEILRSEVGWAAPLMVDLRALDPAARAAAALAAIQAGSDLLLTSGDPEPIIAALLTARQEQTLPAARLAEAAGRVLAFKMSRPARSIPPPDSAVAQPPRRTGDPLADSLATRLTLRFTPALDLRSAGPVLLLTPAGQGESFAAALAEQVQLRLFPLDPAADPAELSTALRKELRAVGSVLALNFPGAGPPTAEALLAAMRDSIPPGIRTLTIEFRGGAFGASFEPFPRADLVTWGAGGPSQRAAVRVLLDPERGTDRWSEPLIRADPAEVGMSASRLDAADRAIAAALAEGTMTAAALAIGRHGRLVRLRGYGSLAGEAAGAELDLFDLASLTKVVGTTTAAAMLVDEGTLELDRPVQRYLPDFRGPDKDRVTIRQLLTHTSGLPAGLGLYFSTSSPEQALAEVLAVPLRSEPGARVEYSDLGMIVLAAAVERAAGMEIDRLLAERLFLPLALSSTLFLPPLAFRGDAVPTATRNERPFPLRGVVHDGNAYRLGGITGHAGLFSTARDLATFAQMMLAGGTYGGITILADSTVRTFTARQPGAEERALGWDTPSPRSSAGRYLSARSYGHTGFTGTSLWIDPERELFIVLLTNRTFENASTRAILDLRIAVHEAAARAIEDLPIVIRPGAR